MEILTMLVRDQRVLDYRIGLYEEKSRYQIEISIGDRSERP